MNTEITDNKVGWVLYDGDCSLCTGWARRFAGVLRRAGFAMATLQSNAQRPDACPAPEPTEMLVLTPDGRTFGGADGLVQIARRVWWAWPLFALAQFPGVMPLLRASYRWLATNRHCLGGACRVSKRNAIGGWLPLLLMPAATFFLRDALPAWVFMWLLAFALYAGCKWLTLSEAGQRGRATNATRTIGYLLAWPGMDAAAFLDAGTHVAKPRTGEWIFSLAKTLFGAVLIWGVVPKAISHGLIVAGWVGMVGIIFVLHFGVFHLLSLAWRMAGVNAVPLMRAPLLSRSLAEFWGRRWNTAFHELVHRFSFRPLRRRTSATTATLLVFLLSGLVHELVISFPARGGYGLPTGYFLIQGLGVVAEHSMVGRRLGLGRGVRGWLFTMLVAAATAFWLFHPPFINNVILPMLQYIGSTSNTP